MITLQTHTLELPVSAELLFGFLSDLSRHRTFLEPAATDFSGDADSHRYKVEVMGMNMPVEAKVGERIPPTLITIVPTAKKMFDYVSRFEIQPSDQGCTLRLVIEADLPMMMQMMGAEKLLKTQMDSALAKIQALVSDGKIG